MDDNTGARAGDGRPEKVGVYDQNSKPGPGPATVTTNPRTAETRTTDANPAAAETGGSATRWIIAAIVVVLLIIALLYIL